MLCGCVMQESAPFKLSHEMTQLLDPGGHQSSPEFLLFEELCIRAFLAVRHNMPISAV